MPRQLDPRRDALAMADTIPMPALARLQRTVRRRSRWPVIASVALVVGAAIATASLALP